MSILQELDRRILFCDGGMGRLLQDRGLQPGEYPEVWNLTKPEVIIEIGREYLTAGADIINTHTFGANGLKFTPEGEYSLERIIRSAVRNARTARSQAGREEDAYIALDVGPLGKLLKPMGDLSFEAAVAYFGEIVRLGADEGVDLVLIETMSDSFEAKAAIIAAKENCDLPVFVTMTFDEKGKLLTGGNIASTVALLEGLSVDAIGVNCGLGPHQVRGFIEELLQRSSLPVIVNPNAGLPRVEDGETVYDIDADEFSQVMYDMARLGVRVLGGCCGTTPEHIHKVWSRCHDLPPVPVTDKNLTVVTSYATAVEIGGKPIIIGERINPTGKKKFKQALIDHDIDYILNEGLAQQENGAHVLDVNVGLPGIDEAALMEEVVFELQSIIDLPLQIDTSDFAAMERGMRIYNGKPLINSVNGKAEVMEAIFPLVQKYGGVVVALALDEGGIPETAQGRLAVAKKIYQKAAEYGIHQKDIIIDGLAMTISSDSASALVTLETLRRVRDELSGKSVLGVSNISFGLPRRGIINSTFFTLAMFNGLSAAIINPASEDMMRAYYSYVALADLDPQCEAYIGRYAGQMQLLEVTEKKEGLSLSGAIEKGMKERAAICCKELLQEQDSLEIINQHLIPALNVVGEGFEKGTVYLPQLLMSAEAAKAAFDEIKAYLQNAGIEEEKKGKILLATVKGDIHDIGKNIVKVLLENYGYQVFDLGKDVDPQLVVDTVVAKEIPLVGLSALMTTTVPSMEETIKLLRQQVPGVRVMVGGAVLTAEYAKTMDADAYCRDAMASVHYAKSVFS